jgi:hypothetical protein
LIARTHSVLRHDRRRIERVVEADLAAFNSKMERVLKGLRLAGLTD